eukprot:Stramenopile-MAST_4_protein_1809
MKVNLNKGAIEGLFLEQGQHREMSTGFLGHLKHYDLGPGVKVRLKKETSTLTRYAGWGLQAVDRTFNKRFKSGNADEKLVALRKSFEPLQGEERDTRIHIKRFMEEGKSYKGDKEFLRTENGVADCQKFLPRRTKSGLYAGIDFNQTKYNKIVSNFGKLGHGARSPFARILEALGYSKTKLEHQKDARTKKNSMELTEAGNGMFTALFHIQTLSSDLRSKLEQRFDRAEAEDEDTSHPGQFSIQLDLVRASTPDFNGPFDVREDLHVVYAPISTTFTPKQKK